MTTNARNVAYIAALRRNDREIHLMLPAGVYRDLTDTHTGDLCLSDYRLATKLEVIPDHPMSQQAWNEGWSKIDISTDCTAPCMFADWKEKLIEG